MEGTLGLMDLADGEGGGGDGDGSISTVSKEDNNMVLLSSEASSSYPDDSADLELGLALGNSKPHKIPPPSSSWGQYGKIFTAKDFPSSLASNSSSSCSSSSSATKVNNKRAADSISPPRSTLSQVVGWPPIRTYRMNTLQTKSALTGEISPNEKIKNITSDAGGNSLGKEKGLCKTSLFVKVNMDGVAIGRKVDLNAHSSYEVLAQTLYNMFLRPSTTVCARSSNAQELCLMSETTSSSRLLNGSSEFVLTYEDKDGDWMLVGDVPWGMFISSVKRLRIMRTSEANGLSTSPIFMERNGRQRNKPI